MKLTKILKLSLSLFVIYLLAGLTNLQASSWNINCSKPITGETLECTMQQEVIMKNSQLPVLQLTLAQLNQQEGLHALLVVPLGIYLPGGVDIQIDAGISKTFPVERCDPDGCHLFMSLTEYTLRQLLSGDLLTVSFFDSDRIKIQVPVDLKGFEDAYKSLSK